MIALVKLMISDLHVKSYKMYITQFFKKNDTVVARSKKDCIS